MGMGSIKHLIEYAKQLSMETEAWAIAFRQKDEKTLYEGNPDGFMVLTNNARYWKADPFLYAYKNKTYIFCEMYDRKKSKGVIGVARLKGGICTRFRKCLEMPTHLSFPYVFEQDGEVFMMPENGASGEIPVFKSSRFPYRWEKAYAVAPIPGMDTVPVPNDREPSFFLTTVNQNTCLVKFRRGESEWETVYENKASARCAGRIIDEAGRLIRPSQNDEGRYGNSLHFNLIDDCSYEGYREHEILHVLPPDSACGESEVSIGLRDPAAVKYAGVHTYNCNSAYEVIDMPYYGAPNRIIFWKKRQKFIRHILKRL